MKITVLGSASGMAVPHRNPSAYLVESKQKSYLIDAGEGVSRQLVRYTKDPREVDCVFISHTHADHAAGLIGLLQLMNLLDRKNSLRIFLPKCLLPDFYSVFPFFQIFQESFSFRFKLLPISEGTVFNEDGFQLLAVSNNHLNGNKEYAEKAGIGTDSYSYYFFTDPEKKVIYTSDINSLDHLSDDSFNAAVLIAECTHLSVDEIIEFARLERISHVIFTHIPPELENQIPNIKKSIPENIEFTNDGDVIEV